MKYILKGSLNKNKTNNERQIEFIYCLFEKKQQFNQFFLIRKKKFKLLLFLYLYIDDFFQN